MKKVLDLIVVYEIVRRLSTPFEETQAFKSGLIDKSGNLLKPRSEMTKEERKIVTQFDILIFNIKKLINKLPGGDSRIKNFATAALMLKEEFEIDALEGLTEETIMMALESVEGRKTFSDFLKEDDAPAVNSIGNETIDPKTIKIRKKKRVPVMKRALP